MMHAVSPSTAAVRLALPVHGWIALFCACLALVAGTDVVDAQSLAAGDAPGQLLSGRLAIYAHLLLAGSTALYLVNLSRVRRGAGLWASTMAALGAVMLLASVAARATEPSAAQMAGHVSLSTLHEVMSLVSAFAVLLYLLMELVYRDRAAGAFVMPIVLAAVLFEAWLLASDPGAGLYQPALLQSYRVQAHVLVNLVSYGAFAVAAAFGALYLLRARGMPAPARLERWGHQASILGLSLFSLAILLGVGAAHDAWGRYWSWDAQQWWVPAVWLCYAAYAWLHRMRHWRGAAMAWWRIAAFALALGSVVLVKLLFSSVHSHA